jgi:ABC-type phosphate transport system substrate-binding protein
MHTRIVLISLLTALAAAHADAEIVVIVNPANPATRMLTDQAAQFFLGKSNMFTPVDQAKDADIRKQFYQKAAGKSLAQMEGIWAKQEFSGKGGAPKNFANDAAVKKAVAADPAAIGYIDKGSVDGTVKVVLTLP